MNSSIHTNSCGNQAKNQNLKKSDQFTYFFLADNPAKELRQTGTTVHIWNKSRGLPLKLSKHFNSNTENIDGKKYGYIRKISKLTVLDKINVSKGSCQICKYANETLIR